jgi:hypothetical protein
MLTVLRNGTYARLFAAQVVALVGTGLLTVALGLLAYDLAGRNAGAVLGTALTIKMLAYVGLAPVITALVARLPKKPVLISADLVRAAMALCLPFITETWQIYVVIFLLQAASATFTPAFTVAGFLFSAFMVAITVLPRAAAPAGLQSSLWHRTTLGVRIFWRNRRLRSLLALNLVVAAPIALVLVNTVVYVRDVLHRPDADLALALACFGIGSMLVALSAPRVLDRFGDRAVMLTGAAVIPLALAGATAVTFLASSHTGWWLLLALWVLLGAANSTILTPSARLLRDASDEHDRPYVFTAQFSLSHACYILTYPLAGWVGAQAGLGWAALALAIIAIIGSAGAFLSWPRHSPMPVTASVTPKESVERSR